ncbi:MAG TPA: ATP-binding cassette domain-containing protein, partial [Asanoa sp.]|nr:ATP-binding cassette domain-containing protein [Asanoa sp.]
MTDSTAPETGTPSGAAADPKPNGTAPEPAAPDATAAAETKAPPRKRAPRSPSTRTRSAAKAAAPKATPAEPDIVAANANADGDGARIPRSRHAAPDEADGGSVSTAEGDLPGDEAAVVDEPVAGAAPAGILPTPPAGDGEERPVVLRLTEVVKTFPGVRALDGVQLEVRAGEVHCLLGQNGAGKSTLIKVLSGAHQPDEGLIVWKGKPATLGSPVAALRLGVA